MKPTAPAPHLLKPKDKPYKRGYGLGLYLLVTPKGARHWRFKYRLPQLPSSEQIEAGREGRFKNMVLTLGSFPEVSLKSARAKRDDARALLASGEDPAANRRALKRKLLKPSGSSFEEVAREWHAAEASRWKSSHAEKVLGRLQRHVFPYLGSRPIAELEPHELLACLKRIESLGTIETARRTLHACSCVFAFAIVMNRLKTNPAFGLSKYIAAAPVRHHASIRDPAKIGGLLRAIDGYNGNPTTRLAMQLAPLVFVRPGELRGAFWSEIDFDRAEWQIPGERMKMGKAHLVPLSLQSIAVLRTLHSITSTGPLLFPGIRDRKRSMSENTVNAALRTMGYTKEEITGHGFRSMASTLLNEHGYPGDVIERQLAHTETNESRRSYNFAEYLVERRTMMQAWADYLDELKNGGQAKLFLKAA